MNPAPDQALDERRLSLVKRKLGDLFVWRMPDVKRTIGPIDLTPFERYETERLTLVDRCREKIIQYSDAQIETILEEQTGPTTGLRKEWHSFLQEEIHQMGKRRPSWFAGGFGHSDHVAEFDHWARMPRFSVEELTCLSVGIEPSNFTKKDLAELHKTNAPLASRPVQFLLRRYELLQRQFDPYARNLPAYPKDFLGWSVRTEFEAHPEFLALLRKYHPAEVEPEPATNQASKTGKREIDMMAQLLAAIAIEEYGWRPSGARSPIPSQISEIMAGLGLQAIPETVLKYLRHGAGFLPPDWEPDKR